jgi:aspartate/methionine/tyrosine aminotransferase
VPRCPMRYRRMPIEVESPEQLGYSTITNNLSESSISDRKLSDLGLQLDLEDLLLCYGDHLGDPFLREQLSTQTGVGHDDVLLTPGAATALFCAATALLERGDHLVVMRSNYATNLETPRAIGAELDTVDLRFEDAWALDVDEVRRRVRPGTTKLISVTVPHNPTGTMMTEADLRSLVDIAESSGAVLLVDETYADLAHGRRLPVAATLSPRAISIASMSKAYGLPGLRVGWALNTDTELKETLLAAKEQIVICGPTIEEHIAGQVLAQRERILRPVLEEVRARVETVSAWMSRQELFEWVRPTGGVVGLVRFKNGVDVDAAEFHRVLLADHGTYVGRGHWFELEDRYFRLGFGWPTATELDAGLAALTAAGEQVAR